MVDKAAVRFLVLLDLVGGERGSWLDCPGMLVGGWRGRGAKIAEVAPGCLNGARRSFRLAGIVFTLAQKWDSADKNGWNYLRGFGLTSFLEVVFTGRSVGQSIPMRGTGGIVIPHFCLRCNFVEETGRAVQGLRQSFGGRV